eukprot:2213302-Alexandrium_andersonii.AAC.1
MLDIASEVGHLKQAAAKDLEELEAGMRAQEDAAAKLKKETGRQFQRSDLTWPRQEPHAKPRPRRARAPA